MARHLFTMSNIPFNRFETGPALLSTMSMAISVIRS